MKQKKLKGLTSQEVDELAINTIRALSTDAANSGHLGVPVALGPLVYMIEAYGYILQLPRQPTAIGLSRQPLPTRTRGRM
jgi:hypothetical protein